MRRFLSFLIASVVVWFGLKFLESFSRDSSEDRMAVECFSEPEESSFGVHIQVDLDCLAALPMKENEILWTNLDLKADH